MTAMAASTHASSQNSTHAVLQGFLRSLFYLAMMTVVIGLAVMVFASRPEFHSAVAQAESTDGPTDFIPSPAVTEARPLAE